MADETQPAQPTAWPAQRVIAATLVVVAIAVAFILLIRFRVLLAVLFIAIVLSTAVRPGVEWLNKRGVPRALGTVLMFLLLLGLAAGVALLVAPLIAEQTAAFLSALPNYYSELRQSMTTSSSAVVQRIGAVLPAQWSQLVGMSAPAGGTTSPATQFLSYSRIVVIALLSLVAIFLLAFYWTLESERSILALLLLVPVDRREQVRATFDEVQSKIGVFIRGQAFLSLTIAVAALVAYLLVGLPYVLVLAVVAGITEAIPIVGPFLGAVLPVLLAISDSPTKLLWTVLATLVIQQLENHLLVPRIMNKAVGVNPVVTLLSLAAFAELFGVVGALMAVPVAAIVQLVLDRFLLQTSASELQGAPGRGPLSLLRYEAQSLAQDVRKQVRDKEEATTASADQIEDAIEAIANDLDGILARVANGETVR